MSYPLNTHTLGLKPRVSHMLGKHSATEGPPPQPFLGQGLTKLRWSITCPSLLSSWDFRPVHIRSLPPFEGRVAVFPEIQFPSSLTAQLKRSYEWAPEFEREGRREDNEIIRSIHSRHIQIFKLNVSGSFYPRLSLVCPLMRPHSHMRLEPFVIAHDFSRG